jgi:hypothetical protein
VAPTANMGMVPGMAAPGSSMMQPPGALSFELAPSLDLCHLPIITSAGDHAVMGSP